MANPMTEEKQMYQLIEDEGIKIPKFIWRTMYLLVGDYLSSIELYTSCCIEEKQSMDLNDAEELLKYNNKINDVYHKILSPEKIEDQDVELLQKVKKENLTLPSVISRFFTNYFGNDLQGMNFLIGDFIDSKESIPVDYVKRIYDRACAMKELLNNLLKATKGWKK